MRKVALRGLFARKLRLVLTALAVALGVTLIAGTYVFTDTINRSFDRIFTQSAKGTDASITPRTAIDTSNSGGTQPTVSPTVLAQVRRQPGVLSAAGSVFDVGTVLGKDGKRIGKGGAPNFIASIADQPRFNAFTIKEGRKPQTADEVAIDAATRSPSSRRPRARTTRSSARPRSPASTPSAARPSSTCCCPRRSACSARRATTRSRSRPSRA
jgi:putative ABC transport system permease protein